jgi:hypothetical protein
VSNSFIGISRAAAFEYIKGNKSKKMPRRFVVSHYLEHVGVTSFHIDMMPDVNDGYCGLIVFMDTFTGKLFTRPYEVLDASKVVEAMYEMGEVEHVSCLIHNLEGAELLEYLDPKIDKHYDPTRLKKVAKHLKKNILHFSDLHNIQRWVEYVDSYVSKYNDAPQEGLDRSPNELCDPLEETVVKMKQLQIEEFDKKLKDKLIINQMNDAMVAGDEFPNGFKLVSKTREGHVYTYRLNRGSERLVLKEDEMYKFIKDCYN